MAAERQARRCAVYTRKSSEEGLEQDFNSLDAQREACEAYIKSQAGEGWKLVRTRYDDGGYSGGSIDRPGLAQLLADIQEKQLDTVVVYKVDRLTRSLADFAKIVEVFDTSGVSFVSVTQQFNTTTSMGRLTLNMLLSFAQFEREVTGERIRDKIAASKQKGMWMGGPVPLGYEPSGRTLTIQEKEAETVRALFRLYLEQGTVRKLKQEADRQGLLSKLRPGANGRMRGGRPFSRGYLYRLLANPIYIGRIGHNGESFEGQHPAIVDRKTWDVVQAKMAANTRDRFVRARATEPSPLKGKLFDEAGAPLTPSHATKSGRRYRYYLSQAAIAGSVASAAKSQHRPWRLPAREIEERVAHAVASLLADRAELTRLAREAEIEAECIPDLLHAVRDWTGAPLEIVKRVELGKQEIAIGVDLSTFLGGDTVVRYVVPARIRRRGVEMRIVIDGAERGSSQRKPDPALIKAVVRARGWLNELVTGRVRSYGEIAKREDLAKRYVGHLIPLAFLSRKRPRQTRARTTVDVILMAAAHILKREGFAHTTTNRIAQKAGVSVGSLYQYFPNKEAIIAALRERHNDWYDECLRAEIERNRGMPLREGVRRAVERVVAIHALDPALHGALTTGEPSPDREVQREGIALLREFLVDQAQQLGLRDPDLTCFILVHAVEAVIQRTSLDAPQRLRDPNFVNEVTELFVRYVDRS